MGTCIDCSKEVSIFRLSNSLCPDCAVKAMARQDDAYQRQLSAKAEQAASLDAAVAEIILMTETAHNLPVDRRLYIVSAEAVIGLHLFKDIASAFRNTFGGRSKKMQDGLRDARKVALSELRREA